LVTDHGVVIDKNFGEGKKFLSEWDIQAVRSPSWGKYMLKSIYKLSRPAAFSEESERKKWFKKARNILKFMFCFQLNR